MSFVAERQFEFLSASGVETAFAQVSAPRLDQEAWRCDYRIVWPGYERARYAMGVDSWQATQLAMQAVATEILLTDDFKAGRVSEFGRPLITYDDLTEWLGVRPMKVLQQ